LFLRLHFPYLFFVCLWCLWFSRWASDFLCLFIPYTYQITISYVHVWVYKKVHIHIISERLPKG
jgi:hypothetical protein